MHWDILTMHAQKVAVPSWREVTKIIDQNSFAELVSRKKYLSLYKLAYDCNILQIKVEFLGLTKF